MKVKIFFTLIVISLCDKTMSTMLKHKKQNYCSHMNLQIHNIGLLGFIYRLHDMSVGFIPVCNC